MRRRSPKRDRSPKPVGLLALALVFLPGCEGEIAALVSLAFGTALGAWMVSRDRQNRALYAAEHLRHAIATGQQREIEMNLRKQLALAAAGEAVSVERQWLARAQLGGLLVAEWRLDEAREIYGADDTGLSPHLQDLAAFGRHELAILTGTPDEDRLTRIREDRDNCLNHVPPRYRELVADAWRALEGLCLVRMGRAREASGLLERGMSSLAYNPARVVYLFHLGQAYEHLGERQLAGRDLRAGEQGVPWHPPGQRGQGPPPRPRRGSARRRHVSADAARNTGRIRPRTGRGQRDRAPRSGKTARLRQK